MDGSRINRLKVKLQIGDWEDLSQKQFNDLVTNLSFLDQETVRAVIKNIPDLSEKVLNYFTQLNDSVRLKTEDYLESLKTHNEVLMELMKTDLDPKLKNKIADELLAHSKWLRKEATATRIFKMAVAGIGMGLAFLFIRGMSNSNEYRSNHAKIHPQYKENMEYETPDRNNEPNDYGRYHGGYGSYDPKGDRGMYSDRDDRYPPNDTEKRVNSYPIFGQAERRNDVDRHWQEMPINDSDRPSWRNKLSVDFKRPEKRSLQMTIPLGL